ncbi:MAG: VWA domain-containing protein [Clostridia bacterium]|nr:VWA domain-containing protein [Clostridia bacterium]
MNKLRFDWIMFLGSVLFSVIAAIICSLFENEAISSFDNIVIYSALFFSIPLTVSIISMGIVEIYRRKNYEIQKRGNRIIAVIVGLVFSAGIGAGGQALYSYLLDESGENKTEIIKDNSADISIIIDYSGSMYGFLTDCKNATCSLIDDISEKDSIQLIIFSDRIMNSDTNLYPATKDNKELLKNTVNSTDLGGGTSFEPPLNEAYNILTSSGSVSPNKAVIMVTDGQAYVSDSLKDKYIQAGIPLYCIGVNTEYTSIEDFVTDTGGYTIPLDGEDIDNGKLLNEFRKIYEDEIPSEEKTMEKRYLPMFYGSENAGILELLIRFAVLVVYGILATWCMYYTLSKESVITSLITSVILSLILYFTESYFVVIPLFTLAFWISLTRYYPSDVIED